MVRPYVLIMAGGEGTRLWPLSRKKRPKQLLPLLSKKTLLEETLKRAMFITNRENIYIGTNAQLKKKIRKKVPYLKEKQFIVEPEGKNTAPIISLFCAWLKTKRKDTKAPVVVLAADHFISPCADWANAVESTYPFLENYIFCMGVKPTRPDTGYGYIETGSRLKGTNKAHYQVVRFREKPDLDQAQEYFADQKFCWNSGMFIFSAETFLKELVTHAPNIYETAFQCLQSKRSLKQYFSKMPNISVDYAIMEKTKNLAVVKTHFRWDDIGGFLSFERIQEKDEHGNCMSHQSYVQSIDSTGNIIFANGKKLKVALLGIQDLVVAHHKGVLLIAKKEEAHKIKSLREKFSDDLY